MSIGQQIIDRLRGFLNGDAYTVSTVCPNCVRHVSVEVPKGVRWQVCDSLVCPRCGVGLKPKTNKEST